MVIEYDMFRSTEAALADWMLAAARSYAAAIARAPERNAGDTARALAIALHPIDHVDDVSFAGLLLQYAERYDALGRRDGGLLAEQCATAHLEAATVQAVRRWRNVDGVGALSLILEILALRSSVAGVRAASELLRAGRLQVLDDTATSRELGHRFVDLAMSAAASEPAAQWILRNVEAHPLLWDEGLRPMVCVGLVRAEPASWLTLLARHLSSFTAARPMVRRVNLRAMVEAAGLVSIVHDTANTLAENCGGEEHAIKIEALKLLFRGNEAPLQYYDEAVHFGSMRCTLYDSTDPHRVRHGVESQSLPDIHGKFAVLSGESIDIVEAYDLGFPEDNVLDFAPHQPRLQANNGMHERSFYDLPDLYPQVG